MSQTTQSTSMQSASQNVRLMTMLVAAAVISSVAAAVAIYSAVRQQVAVIGATDSGRFIPAVPLDQAYVKEGRVTAFAEECLRRAFAHDFVNFRQTVDEAKRCFTPKAAELFSSALDPMLEDLKRRRMVMQISVARAPVVIKPYKLGGVYTWDVQAEIALSLEGTRDRVTPTMYRVDMRVTRVDLEMSTKGILLSHIELRPLLK